MLQVDTQINAWNKSKKDKKLKLQLKNIASIIRALEIDFFESQKNDRLLLMAVRRKTTENSSLQVQLEESRKENQQISDMVQLKNEGGELSRDCSNLGSSISTISLIHLQYKYEELVSYNRGLLKILETKSADAKKYIKENQELQDQIQKLTIESGSCEDKVAFLQRKLSDYKKRKHDKISKLKAERQTLALVHRRLVALLHRQCMEKNDFIKSLLKTTTRSEKGLLLQEIRKNNMLAYENFQLQQELQYLRSLFNLSRVNSKGTMVEFKHSMETVHSKESTQSKQSASTESVRSSNKFLKKLQDSKKSGGGAKI
ncbi:unnamed protein product [Ceutorhynchus assimilis]|uniref:Uncharacterized protein n=1 Tax=Ceutorhynchus assimilis TaxID=467358 RepID=A0A9N9MYI2_9CUCU|nr:unnamed protein product [Ceutorhynchus assimilis]